MTTKDAVIARIVAAQRRVQLAMARSPSNPLFSVPLTISQLKILIALRHVGAAGGQELAQMMGVSPATMTGIVDRLVAAGYVSRREDTRDRRIRRTQLTPEGTRLIDDMIVAGEAHQRRLLERLPVRELVVVAQAMEIMRRAVDEDEALD